jgi:RNA polymerase sigma factor (TIGR02999 family)
MTTEPQGDITRLLARAGDGDLAAKERLLEAAYGELHALASQLMRRERPGHTLQPTALVHEAVLRLDGSGDLGRARHRSYFFAAMAQAMQRILVEHARRRRALRRGGDRRRMPLDEAVDVIEHAHGIDVIDLDGAIELLENMSARQSAVVRLKFFVGLGMREIAEQLEVSTTTVEKDWRVARAWLRVQLERGQADGP